MTDSTIAPQLLSNHTVVSHLLTIVRIVLVYDLLQLPWLMTLYTNAIQLVEIDVYTVRWQTRSAWDRHEPFMSVPSEHDERASVFSPLS